jgi:hypothetical protein
MNPDIITFTDERHVQYKDYQNIYENYENEWVALRKYDNDISHPYIFLSLPREIVLLTSDLSFSTPINAFINNNEDANNALDEIIEDNMLNMQLSEASITQAVKGGVVAKNYLDNGKSKITFIEPDYYFPEFSPTDRRKIIRETIAFTSVDTANEEILYTETYEPRNGEYWCITRTYKGKNNYLNDQIEVNTHLTESPITYIPFIRSGTNFWGDSIYKGLTDLFDELNWRVTQIANVLDKHSDPNMYADESFFVEDENGGKKLPIGGKAFPVDSSNGEEPPGYITYDWSADANFKFIEDIVFKVLHYVSPIAPALYGLDNASQASGRSLLLKSWRTQSLIKRNQTYWIHALKKILYLAQQLQIISGEKSYTPAIPNVELKISLPHDRLEEAQAEQLKVQSGLTSIHSAISRLNPHYTSAEVEEEYQRILAEKTDELNATFVTNQSRIGLNGE